MRGSNNAATYGHTGSNVTLRSNTVAGRTDFFSLTNVQPSQGGNYRVIVRNPAWPTGVAVSFALAVLADTDGDGLPDQWETDYFGEATAGQPGDDADGDGALNWQEYVAGTDPTNALSRLQVDRITLDGSATVLQFLAVSNRTYTAQFTDSLAPAAWQRLADVLACPTNRMEALTNAGVNTNRFYRLMTPRWP